MFQKLLTFLFQYFRTFFKNFCLVVSVENSDTVTSFSLN
ncbi:Uncharacterised protein [Mycobacterium tuberculosis]|nr:Uncharacterised protein [Mycobacterium tuberculosis]